MVSERLTLLTAVRLEFGLLRGDVQAFIREWPGVAQQPPDWTGVHRRFNTWFEAHTRAPVVKAPPPPTEEGVNQGPPPLAAPPAAPAATTERKTVRAAYSRLAAVLQKNHPDLVGTLNVERQDLPLLLTTFSPKPRLIRAIASIVQLAPEVLGSRGSSDPAEVAVDEAAAPPTAQQFQQAFLTSLQNSFKKIRILASASASEQCLADLLPILKGIPILFVADRDDNNEYAELRSDGEEFTAARGTPTPPPMR